MTDFEEIKELSKKYPKWNDPERLKKIDEKWKQSDNYKECLAFLEALSKE